MNCLRIAFFLLTDELELTLVLLSELNLGHDTACGWVIWIWTIELVHFSWGYFNEVVRHFIEACQGLDERDAREEFALFVD